jgi:hypothetical protein
MRTRSFRLLSSLGGGGLLSSGLLLFFLFLGLVDGPFLLALNGELKRSLSLTMRFMI